MQEKGTGGIRLVFADGMVTTTELTRFLFMMSRSTIEFVGRVLTQPLVQIGLRITAQSFVRRQQSWLQMAVVASGILLFVSRYCLIT